MKIKIALLCLTLLVLLIPAALTDSFEVMDETLQPDYTPEPLPAGFVRVRDVIPGLIEEMRYAGAHNFTGAPVEGYESNTAILTEEAAAALKAAAGLFGAMGYRIKIFDAYRPQRAVKSFMAWADSDDMSTREEFYPDFRSKWQLVDQGYIARNSAHMKGSAVDMTLTDMDGNELDMGTGFDYFGALAWHGARGITQEQSANRSLLRSVMEQCGFKAFEHEWWHYRLKNQPYPDMNFDFPVN